ncbi:hypothetical protein Tco_0514405 [Tanacetum coccineum]
MVYVVNGVLANGVDMNLEKDFASFALQEMENSSIDAPNPNSFNDLPNIFTHPPQPQYQTYSCELCGNNSHYGYDCLPRFSLDEVIKSSVEDLVPIPNEYKDTSNNDSENDLPFCDNFMTFSNPLFNDKDNFTSSDDESLPEEDVPKENFKIYSNPLFEFDDEYIFRGEIDEIDAFLDMDISTDFEDDYYDSEGDIIYLESLLIKDTIPNLPPEVFLENDLRSLEDEPDKDDLKNIVKVFDPGIWEKIFSPTYVKLPFEDRHYLSLTYVI